MDKNHHNYEMEHPIALKLWNWLVDVYSNSLTERIFFFLNPNFFGIDSALVDVCANLVVKHCSHSGFEASLLGIPLKSC